MAWLVYRNDGTWSANPGGGRWRLAQGRLSLRLSNGGRAGSEEKLPSDEQLCHTEQIEWRGANEFITKWEDGSVHRLARCDAEKRPTISCLGDCSPVTPFDEHGWMAAPRAAKRPCR